MTDSPGWRSPDRCRAGRGSRPPSARRAHSRRPRARSAPRRTRTATLGHVARGEHEGVAGALVRWCASTTTKPRSSVSVPAAASPRSPVSAYRPAATNSRSALTVRRAVGARQHAARDRLDRDATSAAGGSGSASGDEVPRQANAGSSRGARILAPDRAGQGPDRDRCRCTCRLGPTCAREAPSAAGADVARVCLSVQAAVCTLDATPTRPRGHGGQQHGTTFALPSSITAGTRTSPPSRVRSTPTTSTPACC
jgi:hypothetical protein